MPFIQKIVKPVNFCFRGELTHLILFNGTTTIWFLNMSEILRCSCSKKMQPWLKIFKCYKDRADFDKFSYSNESYGILKYILILFKI